MTFISFFLNYKVFESHRIQPGVINDFNKRIFKEENYIKLKNLDLTYPNLTVTAFPFSALLAEYQISFGEFNEALQTLNNSVNINPHLKIKESLKAEIFFQLGIRDSAYFYSKIAYENLPKNSRHFQQYIRELTHKRDVEKLKEVFYESTFKSNPEYWLNFLSGVVNIRDKNDKEIDSIAFLALDKFPKNDKINSICGFILYGQKNIEKSYELFKSGVDEFNYNNFIQASKIFSQAYDLNPLDNSFLENAGMALIKAEKYDEAISNLEKVVFSKKNPLSGKPEYGLAICHRELGQIQISCDYFKKSMQMNFRPSFIEFENSCNKKIKN